MSTYGAFKTDPILEQNGIWLDFGTAGKILVARAGGSNSRFEKRLMALTKPYRKAIQTDTLDKKTDTSIILEAFLDTVILSWEGVTGEDGNDLPFNKENAKKLFTDLPDFFRSVKMSAENAALYRSVMNEDDLKN